MQIGLCKEFQIYLINSIDNTKLPCCTLPPTQHRSSCRTFIYRSCSQFTGDIIHAGFCENELEANDLLFFRMVSQHLKTFTTLVNRQKVRSVTLITYINFNFPQVYRCNQRLFFNQSGRSQYLDYFIKLDDNNFQLFTQIYLERQRKRSVLENHLHIHPSIHIHIGFRAKRAILFSCSGQSL